MEAKDVLIVLLTGALLFTGYLALRAPMDNAEWSCESLGRIAGMTGMGSYSFVLEDGSLRLVSGREMDYNPFAEALVFAKQAELIGCLVETHAGVESRYYVRQIGMEE